LFILRSIQNTYTHVWTERRIVNVKLVVNIVTTGLYRVKSLL